MTKTWLLLFASVLVLLEGCASGSDPLAGVPPVPATPIRDTRIVPGYRIGPVALGMDPSALYGAMGQPTRSSQGDYVAIYEYPGMSVWVSNRLNRVTQIYATQSTYTTQEGIGAGDSELRVRATYGAPARTNTESFPLTTACYRQGMGFWFMNGNVQSIAVWSPGC